jgi:hypothetical protein
MMNTKTRKKRKRARERIRSQPHYQASPTKPKNKQDHKKVKTWDDYQKHRPKGEDHKAFHTKTTKKNKTKT